jgi:hypothetical protein
MKQHKFNSANGLWYELQGDVYIPCLILPGEDRAIGKWGRKYERYLKEHKPVRYTNLLTTGKLNAHLAEVDTRAVQMQSRLEEQFARREGITEALKESDPMTWVSRMTNIRNRVEEIVDREVIFA